MLTEEEIQKKVQKLGEEELKKRLENLAWAKEYCESYERRHKK